MPNIKSATKRMNLSRAANARNRKRRSTIRTALKRVRGTEDANEAQARFRHAASLLDRAARSRLMHPNRAARLKGQLARYVESLSS